MDTPASGRAAMPRGTRAGRAALPRQPREKRANWLPEPESLTTKGLIRGTALFALVLTGVYLGWRATFTINLEWWWVAIPLFVVEVHNAFGLFLYTVALWDVDVLAPAAPGPPPGLRIAILIPTFNEPPEVLLPTIAASVALRPRHETWVLDDGRRDAVRDLAEKLGARYLARPDNRHAKAGNLNHALGVIMADIVAVLDADHVPTARFLTATLPYFGDDRIAFVQTPQDFYNLDSFEHQRGGRGEVFNEEAVFYRVIAPAKNRWSAPFWCGTCALIRVEALRSVGGVATGSVTEDIHTTIRMYRAGWHGTYHNEVLARGLAPDDAEGYLLQRNRWAFGAMQVLRQENPLFGRGLTLGQRLAFMTTLFGWFDSWRMLAYMLIPLAVVGSGAVPIDAPAIVFAPFFATTLVLQFTALRLLARGRYPPVLSVLFEVLRMPAVLPATLAVIAPNRRASFRVTPKGRNPGGRIRVPVPRLLTGLAVASSLGLAWFALTLLGLGPVAYSVPWAAIGAAFFMALNLALVLAAIGRIRSSRFAGNRRAAVRLAVSVPAHLAGLPCEVLDLSVAGARVLVPDGERRLDDAAGAAGDAAELPEGALPTTLGLDLGGTAIELTCTIRRRIATPDGGVELGLAFNPDQERAIARLAVRLFHPSVPPPSAGSIERKPVLLWRQAAA